jgi:hypothetical protein
MGKGFIETNTAIKTLCQVTGNGIQLCREVFCSGPIIDVPFAPLPKVSHLQHTPAMLDVTGVLLRQVNSAV